jgi:hypothetical protein
MRIKGRLADPDRSRNVARGNVLDAVFKKQAHGLI